jgi:hypothetical protein
MEGFKDPARLTRIATIALYAYMVLDVVHALVGLPKLSGEIVLEDAATLGAADWVLLVEFVAVITCVILVGRWIYRTNANAHLFSDGMTISPGWAVGWYFIPLPIW